MEDCEAAYTGTTIADEHSGERGGRGCSKEMWLQESLKA